MTKFKLYLIVFLLTTVFGDTVVAQNYRIPTTTTIPDKPLNIPKIPVQQTSANAQYTEIAMVNNDEGGFWLLGTDNKVTSVSADLSSWTPYPGGGLGLHLRSNGTSPLLVGMNSHFYNTNGQVWTELPGGGFGKLFLSDQITKKYWCLGDDQTVFSFNGQAWGKYGNERFKDLAVYNETLYAIGIDDKIYRSTAPGRWEHLAQGSGSRITVDMAKGGVWCIGPNNTIQRFNGTGWEQHPGNGQAKEIGVIHSIPYVIALADGSLQRGVNGGWERIRTITINDTPEGQCKPCFTGSPQSLIKSSQNITGQSFKCMNIDKGKFYTATLTKANFEGSNLQGANFYGTYCYSTIFDCCNLSSASFLAALMGGASFKQAILNGAALSGADVKGANFTNANLQQAKLDKTNFTEAICVGADFSGANCTGANFTNADLTNTNFVGAELTNAIFTGAKMEGIIGYKPPTETVIEFDKGAKWVYNDGATKDGAFKMICFSYSGSQLGDANYWILKTNNTLWLYSGNNAPPKKLPINALYIASKCPKNGYDCSKQELLMVGTDNKFYVLERNEYSGESRTKIEIPGKGLGTQIAYDDRTKKMWCLGMDKLIYTLDERNSRWVKYSERPVTQFDVYNNIVYAIGTDAVIYKNTDGSRWEQILGGSGKRILIERENGCLWAIGTDSKLYYATQESTSWKLEANNNLERGFTELMYGLSTSYPGIIVLHSEFQLRYCKRTNCEKIYSFKPN